MIRRGIQYWRAHIAIDAPVFSGVRESIQWLMLVRLGILYLLFVLIIAQEMLRQDGLAVSQVRLAYTLFAVSFSWNLVWSMFIHRVSSRWVFADLQIAFDVFIVSLWIFFSGEQGMLFALFYLIEILVVSVILYQRGAWFASLLSCVMFGLVVLLQPQGGVGSLALWGGFSAIYMLVGVVGGYLSEELVRTTISLKENQEKMERLSALHERILSNMPTGLLTVDRELNINFINPAGEQILGKLSREMAGRPLSDVEVGLMPFFNQIESEAVSDSTEDRQDEYQVESAMTGEHHRTYFQSVRKSGLSRLQQTVEVGSGAKRKILRGDVAVLDAEAGLGNLLDKQRTGGRVLLFQDVTKLVTMEDKFKQTEKLAAVGQLAAGIAHEIRNPLAGMSASIEMLKQGLPEKLVDRENQKLMDIAIREIDRLNRLISEFLDYVKPDKMKCEKVDLLEILSEVAQTALQAKENKHRVGMVSQMEKGVFASASPGKLKQVMWNLITNSAQAMPQGGDITIGCAVADNQLVKFWVEDRGAGMSDEIMSHLYEPFFTTKEKGTGLGLATVYKIVEAHQGEIKVKSKVGVGTRFEVFLPKA